MRHYRHRVLERYDQAARVLVRRSERLPDPAARWIQRSPRLALGICAGAAAVAFGVLLSSQLRLLL